jgi:hypothetical protein
MNIAWKIYFWIYASISLLGTIMLYGSGPLLNLYTILSELLNVVIIVGTYSYVYKKNLLPKIFWFVIFWVFLVLSSIYSFLSEFTFLKSYISIQVPEYLDYQLPQDVLTLENFLIGLVISLPSFIAIYRLSKDKFLD